MTTKTRRTTPRSSPNVAFVKGKIKEFREARQRRLEDQADRLEEEAEIKQRIFKAKQKIAKTKPRSGGNFIGSERFQRVAKGLSGASQGILSGVQPAPQTQMLKPAQTGVNPFLGLGSPAVQKPKAVKKRKKRKSKSNNITVVIKK